MDKAGRGRCIATAVRRFEGCRDGDFDLEVSMRWLRTAGILAVVFLTGAAQAEVPLSWDSTGHVVVPAMVNGKGPFERRHVVARVVDLPSLEGDGLAGGPAMILGLDLLRGTRLTVDYTSRRFWLAKSPCASRDPDRRCPRPGKGSPVTPSTAGGRRMEATAGRGGLTPATAAWGRYRNIRIRLTSLYRLPCRSPARHGPSSSSRR
jgi:hypothetical protein